MSLLILLAVPGALLYPCLSFHLFEPDEGRYAEIPREMLVRGDCIVPYLQSEPYLDKPPLLYWLVAASYRVFGIHDWSARLIPALAVHATVLLVYFFGRRYFGERAALCGALILGLAPGFASIGRLLILDGLLAFCVTLSIFATFEASRTAQLRWDWWLTAAAACGLGILTKGPVALILVIPPLWAQRWLTGNGCRIGWPAWLAFLGLLLAIALPWYVAICWRLPEFAAYFLWEQNVVRFLSPFDHLQPFWFYAPILLLGFLPASLLAVPLLRFLLTSRPEISSLRSPELGFCVLAGGWCLLFFSLSGCKLPTYILPSFPPLALVFGSYLTQMRWTTSFLAKPMLGLALVILAIGHFLVIPRYAHFRSPMSRPEAVWALCGDPQIPVICYPRPCDSVGFYLQRHDLRIYRSKDTPTMVRFLEKQPRTVILFTHRHSLEALQEVLPKPLELTNITPLGGSFKGSLKPEYCYLAVIEQP